METKTKVRTNWKQLYEAEVRKNDALTQQLAEALAKKDSVRRDVPELTVAQVITNRDLSNLRAIELHVGDIVLRAPDGTVVRPAKNTIELDGKRVPSSNLVPSLRQRFDAHGQAHLPNAQRFIEAAKAVGWVPVSE